MAELTKADLAEALKPFATKADLQGFATKADLAQFATKEDLRDFATKKDLQRFATKEDLRRFATKEDFAVLASQVGKIEATMARREDLAVTNAEVKLLRAKLDQSIASYADSFQEMAAHMDQRLAAAGL